MIQVTLIRIEGYGPWTLTLGSDREHHLQMLQSKLYSDIQMQFSKSNGLVFFNRFDEMFAITNGISVEKHREILDLISTSYDLDISMCIGRGATPYEAHINAYNLRSNSKVEAKVYAYDNNNSDLFAQIMHVDVDDFTSTVSSKHSPYNISSLIFNLYSKLSETFIPLGALTFFLGGDNFMIPSNGVSKEKALNTLEKISDSVGVKLKCGIGKARTAREAARLATEALDTIRGLRKEGRVERVLELSCL